MLSRELMPTDFCLISRDVTVDTLKVVWKYSTKISVSLFEIPSAEKVRFVVDNKESSFLGMSDDDFYDFLTGHDLIDLDRLDDNAALQQWKKIGIVLWIMRQCKPNDIEWDDVPVLQDGSMALPFALLQILPRKDFYYSESIPRSLIFAIRYAGRHRSDHLTACNTEGRCILHHAIVKLQEGCVGIAKILHEECRELFTIQDGNGDTAAHLVLSLTARLDHRQSVMFDWEDSSSVGLFLTEESVRTQNIDGYFPLHVVCKFFFADRNMTEIYREGPSGFRPEALDFDHTLETREERYSTGIKFFLMLLEKYPEASECCQPFSNGSEYPIHVLLRSPSLLHGVIISGNTSYNLGKAVSMIVRCAQATLMSFDLEGELPLHIAMKNAAHKTFPGANHVLLELIAACPQALETRSRKDNLFPFQFAATLEWRSLKPEEHTDRIFDLLRAAPNLVATSMECSDKSTRDAKYWKRLTATLEIKQAEVRRERILERQNEQLQQLSRKHRLELEKEERHIQRFKTSLEC